MVGYDSGGKDRMGDSCIMGLMLVPLAVGVDKQGKEAAKNTTAEPRGHHVELLSSAVQDRESRLQSAIFLHVPAALFSVPRSGYNAALGT